jgi:hypothetical protein
MMENLYAGEEGEEGDDGHSRSESFEERMIARGNEGMGDEEIEQEQRIYDFHRTIERIKTIF